MQRLYIDIETRSCLDLTKVGVYRYCEDPDFTILLFAYSVDGTPVRIIDLTETKLPEFLIEALIDHKIIKHAFNAQFERVCLSRYLKTNLSPKEWHCTMVHAAYAGLAGGSLKQIAITLRVQEKKDVSGTRLINKFSKPQEDRQFLNKKNDPEGWKQFMAYCAQDVRTEIAIENALVDIHVPESEWKLYALDQEINDRGIKVDSMLAHQACILLDKAEQNTQEALKKLTGLDNPNSVVQLKGWLEAKGYLTSSLDKEAVNELLTLQNLDKVTKEVLLLRQEAGHTSTKKYYILRDAVCSDGRIRGCLQFFGASTGRWAGRLLQIQNLYGTKIPELEKAREFACKGDYEALEIIYGSVPYALKNLIRTALIAEKGKKLYVVDFSQIEARVLAWLAGENWVINEFAVGSDIYKVTAAKMFKISPEKVTKEQRQKGKTAILACGYAGGVGAMDKMSTGINLSLREQKRIVNDWRKANPNIVRFWSTIEQVVKHIICTKSVTKIKNIYIGMTRDTLYIELPSGRRLHYRNAKLKAGIITYEDAWSVVSTYGGKLVENITQAVARDLLADAMMRLNNIIFSVHDEICMEGNFNFEDIKNIMRIPPSWAEGLPMDADGFVSKIYKK